MVPAIKNPPASAGDARDTALALIPGSVRFPGGGNGNPLQISYLENPMDRGARWVTVHGIEKSQTGLSTHAGKNSLFLTKVLNL